MKIFSMENAELVLNKAIEAVHQQKEEEEESALEYLISLSRDPNQRATLAQYNAVPRLLLMIQSATSLRTSMVILLLKLLRNLCAGDSTNQLAFLHCNGVQNIASLISNNGDNVSIIRFSLQLLGNVSGGGEAQKEEIWRAFFPSGFRALVSIASGDKQILEPVCMILYTCGHKNKSRLSDLCSRDGAWLLSDCLQAFSREGSACVYENDWLSFLVCELCLEEPLLPLLFKSLEGTCERSSFSEFVFNMGHVTLINFTVKLLTEKLQEQNDELYFPMSSEAIAFLVEIARTISKQCKFTETCATLPSGVPEVDILWYAFEIFKMLSGYEREKEKVGHGALRDSRSSLISVLLSTGVIRLCIELLQFLGPPDLILQAMVKHKADSAIDSVVSTVNGSEDGEQILTSDRNQSNVNGIRSQIFYQGFRRDVVAVIANASYRNRDVQDEVRNLGGLPLILQQCVIDEANPFLREWGFWAVRNLLEGNTENSKDISELQLRESITPDELFKSGLKVEIDPVTQRPKLINTSSARSENH